MRNTLQEVMQHNSTATLLKIAREERADYTPEAIALAEQELKSRNLTSEQLDVAEEEISQQKQMIEERANEPLSPLIIILCFVTPGLFFILLSRAYKGEGYIRKSKELVKYTLYAFVFYASGLALIMLLALLIFQSK